MSKRAEKDLQNLHLVEQRRTLYIACEDMDFVWSEKDVSRFDFFWNNGLGIEKIAKRLKRDIDEVVILIMDRARKGYIKPRKGGLML
jgi:fructose-1,6-bisphosphatase/sedoheptulose 1,7-bisphosphatase-like protein